MELVNQGETPQLKIPLTQQVQPVVLNVSIISLNTRQPLVGGYNTIWGGNKCWAGEKNCVDLTATFTRAEFRCWPCY
jgi:hypothetical protein